MEINEADYLIVTLLNFLDIGIPEYIIGVVIDNSNIILLRDNKKIQITNYTDYKIAIILDLDNFIPSGTTLRIFPIKHKEYDSGCSIFFRPRKSCIYRKLLPNKLVRFSRKDIRTYSNKSKPIKLLAKVSKIDKNKKYIDLSIGDCYKLIKSEY